MLCGIKANPPAAIAASPFKKGEKDGKSKAIVF
jgi:hypothetical protein